ncbi:MAG: GTPase HflX [Anaerorhabdus sp.]|uniref:GTPase HflX n=1 Tax=Anaerorhabdus sp. TaxID=1872524 RepID=UPI002FC78939
METKKEQVLIIYIKDNKIDQREELIQLAKAANMEVIQVIDVNLRSVTSSTYLGKGKIEEIAVVIEELNPDLTIISKELSPLQSRNLEAGLNCILMDRTALILEIFSARAKTREAKLQIEAAQLRFLLTKLVGSTAYLGRQSGGQNKGAGEKKLELNRRVIKKQIAVCASQLKELEKQRKIQSASRINSKLPLVSLVGYTNAGKSTIMNAMLEKNGEKDKQVFAKDMLFATLDTSIRRIHHNHHEFLLSDTVGFVSQLPHDLIQAFHSTLEEARDADLLLQVIDVSDPMYEEQMEVASNTLKEIKADHVTTIAVYNKADQSNQVYPRICTNGIYISANEKDSITLLMDHIVDFLFSEVKTTLFLPYEETELISECQNNSSLYHLIFEKDGVQVKLLYRHEIDKRLHKFIVNR